MAEPPPTSTPSPSNAAGIPSSSASPASPAVPSSSSAPSPAAPPTLASDPLPKPSSKEPLTGFRASLEHTGIPRSVLLWKPRLPSRNWTIFLTVVGTISYLYYDDRKQCKRIKEEYLEKVRYRSMEPTKYSLELPRKVKVIGAKWPEDDDDDRALRYFRKYVKPYLMAAAIDYEQMSAPLHGSITRQLQKQILQRRRRALGLEAAFESALPLPVQVDPKEAEQREMEGGTVIVGRASLKEYMEGLKRGWLGRVDDWDWEKSIGETLEKDGMFEKKVDVFPEPEADAPTPSDQPPPPASTSTSTSPSPSSPLYPPPPSSTGLSSSLSFLSRPPQPRPQSPMPYGSSPGAGSSASPPPIPESMHTPPYPLPPQPPILFVPFVSRLGFKQVPWMIYDFFTERHRVKSGAEAALALIEAQTRDFRGPTGAVSSSSSFSEPSREPDTDFETASESWYKKAFKDLPERMATARKDYNAKLAERVQDVYDLEDGKRQLTDAEMKSTKSLTTIQDLKDERKKKELRWMGSEEGYDIVKPDTPVAWDERFDGWLKVYELPAGWVPDRPQDLNDAIPHEV
ncbi:inner membrane protein import complex subunit Tim54-domain-containing protein [Kockovaella imperatae]|uniref:Mitochondrial import inner membrane translocase subunit TIM54 n=1 Tax=Kockovaella imperatae TaxID=4999 RepID=A0A1Y1UAA8_9TREE|nr:inner membrane protein import complex subunit Tim54-domain-containing protein [Kockovaella imperatae]ORX34991.1 inner membrane protein import complex subunit Tim54-domain-containing protein [Kockovaella imperatae]